MSFFTKITTACLFSILFMAFSVSPVSASVRVSLNLTIHRGPAVHLPDADSYSLQSENNYSPQPVAVPESAAVSPAPTADVAYPAGPRTVTLSTSGMESSFYHMSQGP